MLLNLAVFRLGEQGVPLGSFLVRHCCAALLRTTVVDLLIGGDVGSKVSLSVGATLLVSLLAAFLFGLFVGFYLFLGLHEAAVPVGDLIEHDREDYCVHEDDDEVELEKRHRWHVRVDKPCCAARVLTTTAQELEWTEKGVCKAILSRDTIAPEES